MAWHFEIVLALLKAHSFSVGAMNQTQHTHTHTHTHISDLATVSVVFYYRGASHGLFLGDMWHFPGEHVRSVPEV